jgi:hypothetical protein
MHQITLTDYLNSYHCGEEYQRIESILKVTRKKNSPFSPEYYIARGSTEEEAIAAVKALSKSVVRPKTSAADPQHWINKGLSEEDASIRANQYRTSIGKVPTKEELMTLHGEEIGNHLWIEYKNKLKNRVKKHKQTLSEEPIEASLILWFKMNKTRWGELVREFSYTDQQSYNKAVDTATKISVSLYGDTIDPGRKRLGIIDGKNGYALDHIYSKYGGYVNKVHPLIIGSVGNLQILSKEDNSAKNNYCSTSLDEVLACRTVLDDKRISQEWKNRINEIFIEKKENN